MAHKGLLEDKNGFIFHWKIKTFSLFSMLNEIYISSPVFRIEEMDNTEWCLHLQLGHSPNSYVGLMISGQDDEKEILVDVKLFLMKTNGDIVIEETECIESKDIEQFLLRRSEIFENKTLYLPDDTLTVGCFIKKHSVSMFESTECTAYTDLSTDKFSIAFPFEISSSTLQLQQIKTFLKASVNKKYPDFEIILESSRSLDSSEFMTVKIAMTKFSTDVLCKCKLSIDDTKKETVFLFEGKHKYLANMSDQTWTLANSITSVEEIPKTSNDSNFILSCVLVVSDGTYSSHIESFTCPIYAFQIKQVDFSRNPARQSHMQKLKVLFEDSKLCDFTIQAEGKDFRIHKAVLGALSPVFCAMFQREMKERQNSITIIKDIDADTIQKLINFVYTERVDNLEWDSAIKLYSAADKYQISELKQLCANWIIANLTIENVTEVLTISDMHQDRNLEKASEDFVFAHAKVIFRSENWKKFTLSNMTIANKIMLEICIKLTFYHI